MAEREGEWKGERERRETRGDRMGKRKESEMKPERERELRDRELKAKVPRDTRRKPASASSARRLPRADHICSSVREAATKSTIGRTREEEHRRLRSRRVLLKIGMKPGRSEKGVSRNDPVAKRGDTK